LLDRRAREASVAGTVSSDLATLRTTAVNVESTFPDLKESVLPTQLGNVIRAFEVYPKLRYGIQAIPTWPRLVQTLAAEKAVPIDDAKSAFDFMLNCSVLSAVTGALLTAVGLSNDHPFRVASGVEWLPWTASFSILSYLFYLGAINRAAAWGTQVKAAFDLNRLPLLEAMGYKTEISGPEEERTFWEELSYELVFPNTPNLPKIPYRSGQSTLTVRPVATILAELTGVAVHRQLGDVKAVGFVLAFATRRIEVDRLSKSLSAKAAGDAVVWFAYPKGTSKSYTCDFNRDNGWDVLRAAGFDTVRAVAIDDNWSALRFRRVEFIKRAKS
jgi:hypothetical protein